MSFIEKDAAILISDAVVPSSKLITQAIELINDQSAQNKLQQNISKLALANSADATAEEVYSVFQENKCSTIKHISIL